MKKTIDFILVFDISNSSKNLVLENTIAVQIDCNSLFSSIRKGIFKLINTYYGDDQYFEKNRLKIPEQIDLDNINCYKPDMTMIYYFNLVEIIV